MPGNSYRNAVLYNSYFQLLQGLSTSPNTHTRYKSQAQANANVQIFALRGYVVAKAIEEEWCGKRATGQAEQEVLPECIPPQ